MQERRVQFVTTEAWQDLGTGTQGRSPQEEVSSLLLEVSSRETGPSLGKNITHQSQRGLGFPLGGLGECPLRKPCPTWGGIKGVPTLAPSLHPKEQSSRAFFYFSLVISVKGLPWWFSGKESACQYRRHGFNLWIGKIPWRRKWQPTPAFLPGKSHGQRSLAGYRL